MQFLKSFSTGALAGTIGFFGSRLVTTASPLASTAVCASATALAAYALRSQPTLREHENGSYFALATGAILFNDLSYLLKYANVPDLISLPFILSCNIILNAAITKILATVNEVPAETEMAVPERLLVGNPQNEFNDDYDDEEAGTFANQSHLHKWRVMRMFQL